MSFGQQSKSKEWIEHLVLSTLEMENQFRKLSLNLAPTDGVEERPIESKRRSICTKNRKNV
jgi:negative regulator of sigma E activity